MSYDRYGSSRGYDDRSSSSSSYYRDDRRYDDRDRRGYDDYRDRAPAYRDDHRRSAPGPGSRARLYVAGVQGADVPALERLFDKYGRIIDIALKEGFAFVEFEHERDAQDAVRGRDGYDWNGQRLRVEFSRPRAGAAPIGGPRYGAGPMDPRGPPKCFNCSQEGHMARDCKNGDWSNRCYVCKEEGHRSNTCPQRGGGVGLSSLSAGGSSSAAPAAASSSSGDDRRDDRDRRDRSRSPRRRSRSRSRDRDSAAPADNHADQAAHAE